MNRAELCEAIAKDMKTTKAEADRFLNSMLACLTKGLKKDKAVQLVGFDRTPALDGEQVSVGDPVEEDHPPINLELLRCFGQVA